MVVCLPGDVGPMITALLSDENRWVNGQRIEVSGGISSDLWMASWMVGILGSETDAGALRAALQRIQRN
jgi:hypothetical protein